MGELTEQVWENFILGTKTAYDLKIAAKIEAERLEAERLEAEKIEQERIKKENESLKLQAEQREKELAIERAKAAEELRIANEKAAEEKRIADEAKLKLEQELLKGDSEKFNDLLNDLEVLKTKYIFKSEKNKKKYSDVSILLEKIINHIKN